MPHEFRNEPPDRSNPSDLTDLSDHERAALYSRWLEHPDPAVRANALICLIHQANFLLDRQIAALERQFVEGGGYSEQLATARLAHRKRQDLSDPADPADHRSIPPCPQCGAQMALRTAKTGRYAGQPFWGCTQYPDCKGTQAI